MGTEEQEEAADSARREEENVRSMHGVSTLSSGKGDR